MTRDDIIRMAREAHLDVYGLGKDHEKFVSIIERFAALVAAAEREKVARWQIGSGYTTGHGETIEDLLVELEWQVRESEREACAKVCENMCGPIEIYNPAYVHYVGCAEAIRARGQG